MSKHPKNVVELIKAFRKSKHFRDVVGQKITTLTVPRIVREKLLGLDDIEFLNEFESMFINYFMLGRMGETALKNILNSNNVAKIKQKLIDLFLTNMSPEKKLKSIMELKQVGLFFGTSLLSASSDGEFVIFHEKVLEGIKELKCTWMPLDTVDTCESYFAFNDICKALKEFYGFKSLGEVHEFYWHGKDSNWNFK